MPSPLRSLALVSVALLAPAVHAADSPTKADVEALIVQGQAFLLAQQQPSGSFVPGDKFALGITQLALQALATPPAALPASDAKIASGLAFQARFRQADGSFTEPKGSANYTTSLALMVFAATGTGTREEISGAQNFLFGIQNTDEKSLSKGGLGYGSRGAGSEDLSNTTFAVQALKGSGIPASDPRMQEALKFIERCQDLSSVNKAPWVRNTGGAVYAPDESKAGGSWDGKPPAPGEKVELLPYGSMTYALISSYIALDVKPGDPRLDAALGWVKRNYRFDANPGMRAGKEKEGLFYYYGMMAKSFGLVGATTVEIPRDGAKATVDWRADLFRALKDQAIAAPDGKGVYWQNKADRWGEGLPALTTSYVVLALKRVHAALK